VRKTHRERFEEEWAQSKLENPVATAIFHLKSADDAEAFQRWAVEKPWITGEFKVFSRLVMTRIPHELVGELLSELEKVQHEGSCPAWLELVLVSPATPSDCARLYIFAPLRQRSATSRAEGCGAL